MNEELSFEVFAVSSNPHHSSIVVHCACAPRQVQTCSTWEGMCLFGFVWESYNIFPTMSSSRAEHCVLRTMGSNLLGFRCRQSQSCMCGDVKSAYGSRTSSWSIHKASSSFQAESIYMSNSAVLSVRGHAR